MTGPGICPLIYQRTPCLAVLARFFASLIKTKCSWVESQDAFLLLALSKKKTLLFLSFWPTREYTWTLIWKKSLAYWFVLKTVRVLPVPTGIVGRWKWTLNIKQLKLHPYVRDILDDKSLLSPYKKAFFLSSVRPGREYTWTLI